jgi:suppressor of ftsI
MPMMNWLLTHREVRWQVVDPASGRVNDSIHWSFRQGQNYKIRLVNESSGSLHAMQHPIHLHGQRFLVLSRDGVPNDNLAWKDTVLVPVGSTVDILLEASNPGRWMLHCHIAEHLAVGMGFVFSVDGG